MAETINMPKLGFDMAEGTLVRWVKKVGEQVNKGDVIAEIETDKATVEVESSSAGTIRKLVVDEGAIVPVGSAIAVVGSPDEPIGDDAKKNDGIKESLDAPQTIPLKSLEVNSNAGRVEIKTTPASPLARKIADERKVDLSKIKGTGPGGRIVRRDVENALLGHEPTAFEEIHKPGGQGTPDRDEIIPLTKLRQIIARRMSDSKTSIPHFYVTHEYRMDKLVETREQLNTIFEENEKTSLNDFIVKIAAMALRQFPNLNASLTGTSITHHASINIGVAVAVEGGLMTVVCKNADKKTVRQISREIKEMSARAREGRVKTEDIEGSTFSISNLGMHGVENFAAIINPPEVAIIAVGMAREIPVVENGIIRVGWRMKATISVDHRASDGIEAAKFMQAMERFFEEPLRLLL
jgi:pyruvate dehydrogenase E2 component (dihydrolipoamide acetyltransferase)